MLAAATPLALLALAAAGAVRAAPVPVARLVPVSAFQPHATGGAAAALGPGEEVELLLDESRWAAGADGDDAAEPAALWHTVDWGDGTAAEGPTPATRLRHAYALPGRYEVAVAVSDTDNGTAGAPTAGGWAVPAVSLPLDVVGTAECYTYRVWVERAAGSGYLPGQAHEPPAAALGGVLAADTSTAYLLFVQVTSGRVSGPASGNSDADLTRLFWRFGERPRVAAANESSLLGEDGFAFDAENGWWHSSLLTGPDRGALQLLSTGEGASVHGCTIADGHHAVTLRPRASLAGWALSNETRDAAAAANFAPGYLRVAQDSCSAGYAVMLLGAADRDAAAAAGLGGLAVQSDVAFQGDAGLELDLAAAACGALEGGCGAEGLAVADVAVALDRVLLLTTRGLFRSSPLSARGLATLEWVATGHAPLDTGAWAGAPGDGDASFDRGDLCATVTQAEPRDYLGVRVRPPGDGGDDEAALLVSLDAAHLEWSVAAPGGADAGSARSAAWDEVTATLAVLAEANGTAAVFLGGAAAVAAGAAGEWRSGAVFPDGTALHGLRSTSSGVGILAHGDSVWTSVDGGNRFTFRESLAWYGAGTGEGARAATGEDQFAVLTAGGLVLAGRGEAPGTAELAGRAGVPDAGGAVRAGANGTVPASRAHAVLFDAREVPHLVHVTAAADHAALAAEAAASPDAAACGGDALPGCPLLGGGLRVEDERLSLDRALGDAVFPGRAAYAMLDASEALVPDVSAFSVQLRVAAADGASDEEAAGAAFRARHVGAAVTAGAARAPLATVAGVQGAGGGDGDGDGEDDARWTSAAWGGPVTGQTAAEALREAAACGEEECPASAYSLEVTLEGALVGAAGVALLGGASPPDGASADGWVATDVGRAVVAGVGTYWVRRRLSASAAEVVAFSPLASASANLTVEAAAGGWFLADLRTHRDLAAAGDQTLAVAAAPDLRSATLTLSRAGAAAFPEDAAGLVVRLGNVSDGGAWGVVASRASETEVEVLAGAGAPFTDGAAYAAGEWSLFRRRAGAAWSALPSLSAAERGWEVGTPACPYRYFSGNVGASAFSSVPRVQYLDMGDFTTVLSVMQGGGDAGAVVRASCANVESLRVSLRDSFAGGDETAAAVAAADGGGGGDDSYDDGSGGDSDSAYRGSSAAGSEAGGLVVGLYGVDETALARYGLHSESDSVLVANASQGFEERMAEPRVSHLLMTPSLSSLKCASGHWQTYRLVVGCPVEKRLRLGSSMSGGDEVRLPRNYRPPSSRGRDVPTTQNMYNAHPAAGRPNDFFPVSEETGEFKQCAGVEGAVPEDENPCGCSVTQRQSQLLADSDCIQDVRSVRFSRAFVPDLELVKQRGLTERLGMRVQLTELNGRTDWCLNTTSSCPKAGDGSASRVLDASRSAAIMWTGVQLYHFRVDAIDESNTHCSLTAEFTVYVTTPTIPRVIEFVVLSLTAYTIGFALLLGYLFYVWRNGTGVRKILVN